MPKKRKIRCPGCHEVLTVETKDGKGTLPSHVGSIDKRWAYVDGQNVMFDVRKRCSFSKAEFDLLEDDDG